MTLKSCALTPPRKPLTAWQTRLILAAAVIVSLGVYLVASAVLYRIGFPLDDAWIHATYARNLALRGEWAFVPGQKSGGSTSPLWTALLAPGYWLKLAPFAWAFLVGAAALWGLSLLGETAVRRLVPSYHPLLPWIGIILAFEWHLAWSAVSGMETALFSLLATSILALLALDVRRYFAIGLLIGLSVWVRPDGITLLGPAVLVLLLVQPTWSDRGRSLAALGFGFTSLFALYLFFNLATAGAPWPNTFYAKQAEYASLLRLPFLSRLIHEPLQILEGVGILLLPGFGVALVESIRRRAWGILAGMAWIVGFVALYAWKLPVTYQYGRYIMPVMPAFFLIGLGGMAGTITRKGQHLPRMLSISWRLSAGLVLILFWILGARAYSQDVAYIESEMVATAHWVAVNVPPGDLVAAHDIGALGYYGDHDIVDLAGLISPQVIPFISDPQKLSQYLDRQGVDYLVTFPDWYPTLVQGLHRVYTTGAPFAPALGQTNMAVYRWH
jgi:hypothetical protein